MSDSIDDAVGYDADLDAASFEQWQHPDDDELFGEAYDDHLADLVGAERAELERDLGLRSSAWPVAAEGETIEERNALVLARNAGDREAERPPGEESDPGVDELVRRSDRPALRDDGEAALRLWFKQQVEGTPYTFAQLIRSTRPGRPSDAERDRRDALARLVALARRERQAKVELLAAVLDRPIVTIAALETRGRELLDG
jgi:hypothetical protein